jgi:hypothetical protein
MKKIKNKSNKLHHTFRKKKTSKKTLKKGGVPWPWKKKQNDNPNQTRKENWYNKLFVNKKPNLNVAPATMIENPPNRMEEFPSRVEEFPSREEEFPSTLNSGDEISYLPEAQEEEDDEDFYDENRNALYERPDDIEKLTDRYFQEKKAKKRADLNANANIITKFMLNTEDKRKALFLKTICSESGACISFGTEIAKINQFFDYFITFKYAVPPIIAIGNPSNNGFVKEIKYVREGYEAYSVLKSSAKIDSDNLMYEYEVGQFINKQIQKFPCFVETYGLFVYKRPNDWVRAKNPTQIVNIGELLGSLLPVANIDYRIGCSESKYMAILIQHLKSPKTLQYFKNQIIKIYASTLKRDSQKRLDLQKVILNLVNILYQIYFPLVVLRKQFTHYDLHINNVLLYEPEPGKYINYNYHFSNGEKSISFDSPYIAKIIDYGRSYYYESETLNSKNTYYQICKIANCASSRSTCGSKLGFRWLDPVGEFKYGYLSSSNRNVSHDMRLFYFFAKLLLDSPLISNETKYLFENIEFENNNGTSEKTDLGFKPSRLYFMRKNKKNNICDVLKALGEFIKINNNPNNNSNLKIGEFHIWDDGRPMTFTKN